MIYPKISHIWRVHLSQGSSRSKPLKPTFLISINHESNRITYSDLEIKAIETHFSHFHQPEPRYSSFQSNSIINGFFWWSFSSGFHQTPPPRRFRCSRFDFSGISFWIWSISSGRKCSFTYKFITWKKSKIHLINTNKMFIYI